VVQNFAAKSTALLMNMNCLRRARLLVWGYSNHKAKGNTANTRDVSETQGEKKEVKLRPN